MPRFYLKKCFLFILFQILISCSSDDSFEEIDDIPFTVNFNKFTYGIDEVVSFTISTDPEVVTLCIDIDNFNEGSNFRGICNFNESIKGTNNVELSLSSPGKRTLTISSLRSNSFEENKISYDIEIDSINTLKINNIIINNFRRIGETHDYEYLPNDINRLADPAFVLEKKVVDLIEFNKEESNYNHLYTSAHIENEGNLTFDLSDKDLSINSYNDYRFYLYDYEKPYVGLQQSLIKQAPDFEEYVTLNFSDYASTKPDKITFSFEERELEVVFDVEWN